MFRALRQVYEESLKPTDILFNIYLARPLAVPLVLLFARWGVTPNQVTVCGLLPALCGALSLSLVPGAWGLWMGILALELAYVLDCADGQLARYTGQTTAHGGQLDFAMDGIKALLMVSALAIRVQGESGWTAGSAWLGMGATIALAMALICTYLIRNPAVVDTSAAGGSVDPTGASQLPIWIIAPFKWVAHYPFSLPIFVIFLPLEFFLWAYGGVHVLYAGRSVLVVTGRFGRLLPHRDSAQEDEVR